MDAHDQETQQQESYKKRTAERTTYRSNEDQNAPITAVENQPITSVLHEISRSQSTSSSEED